MGAVELQSGTEVTLLSGPCASNGQRGVIRAVQPGFVPYPNTWLTVPPGGIIEKTFFLQAYPVAREGSGFQAAAEASLDVFKPFDLTGLPAFSEIRRGEIPVREDALV